MYNEMGTFCTFGASICSRTEGRFSSVNESSVSAASSFSSVNESSVSAASSGDSAPDVRDTVMPKEIADNKYRIFIDLPRKFCVPR